MWSCTTVLIVETYVHIRIAGIRIHLNCADDYFLRYFNCTDEHKRYFKTVVMAWIQDMLDMTYSRRWLEGINTVS
jgi:hypothetical protein